MLLGVAVADVMSVVVCHTLSLSLSLSLRGKEEAAVQLPPLRASARPRFTGFVRSPFWVSSIGALSLSFSFGRVFFLPPTLLGRARIAGYIPKEQWPMHDQLMDAV